jgi:hypothetical protein
MAHLNTGDFLRIVGQLGVSASHLTGNTRSQKRRLDFRSNILFGKTQQSRLDCRSNAILFGNTPLQ